MPVVGEEIRQVNVGGVLHPIGEDTANDLITSIKDTNGWIGKNFLKIPSSFTTQTVKGVTFTVNRNSLGNVTSIVLSGTATELAEVSFNMDVSRLEDGVPYYLTGWVLVSASGNKVVKAIIHPSSGSDVELGILEERKIYTYAQGTTAVFKISVDSGVGISATLYPMLSRTSLGDLTFEPYHDTADTCLSTKYDTNDATESTLADADYVPFYDSSAGAKRKSTWSNIKNKLKAYFDAMFDNTPTAGSNNPVKSSGIKSYVDSSIDNRIINSDAYAIRQGKGNLANIRKLIGGTLAWNQLVQNGNFVNTTNWYPTANISVSNNELIYTAPSASQDNGINTGNYISLVNGHKYLALATVKMPSANRINIQLATTDWSTNLVQRVDVSTTNRTAVNAMFAATSTVSAVRLMYFFFKNTAPSVGDVVRVSNVRFIDLTQMFGSTIADAIYAMEQTTAGAGVAWFQNLFPKTYYAYDTGSTRSVKIKSRTAVGKNLAKTAYVAGDTIQWRDAIRFEGDLKPNTNYIISFESDGAYGFYTNVDLVVSDRWITSVVGYNEIAFTTKSSISESDIYQYNSTDQGAKGWRILKNSTTQSKAPVLTNVMVRYASVTDNSYEPHQESICAFDSSKPLRGIPKLVNSVLQYDGDVYTPDGNITRKYGIVNLGDMNYGITTLGGNNAFRTFPTGLKNYGPSRHMQGICGKYVMADTAANLTCCFYDTQFIIRDDSYNDDTTAFKAAMSGVYLVYELATPTTEKALPYQSSQRAFLEGTEEFIDGESRDMTIPVGNETEYQQNAGLPSAEDYTDSVAEGKMSYADNAVLGAKNLLHYPYRRTTITDHGVTFTDNGDGSITISGTASGGDAVFYLDNQASNYQRGLIGSFIMSGAYGGVVFEFGRQGRSIGQNDGVERVLELSSADWTDWYAFTLIVRNGTAISSAITMYPMLRPASYVDGTWVPYAMTNRELTDKVVLREHTYTGTSDANGVVVASTVPHRPIVYCYGAPTGGGNVFVEARPGGGGIAFYCHNNGAKVASTEITIHYFDYQD